MRARDGRNAPLRKLSTRNSQLEVFVRRKGKRARAGALLEHPPSSFSIVILVVVVVTESLVGRVRENSAPLQLTIAIKILPRAPPYELRTLAGRLTSVTSERTRGRGSEDLVSTDDKRSMLQRVRISFPGGRRRVYWD